MKVNSRKDLIDRYVWSRDGAIRLLSGSHIFLDFNFHAKIDVEEIHDHDLREIQTVEPPPAGAMASK